MKYDGADRRKGDRREGNRRDFNRRALETRRQEERRNVERGQESRRQGERREVERREANRRRGERRQSQRREFFRVVYPPDAAPKVLETNYHIIDISCNGIKFYCDDQQQGCQPPVRISQPLKLSIQFKDEEIVEIQGRILRCYADNDLGAKVYCGLLDAGFEPKRINDEQRYLLKHFPDFYRAMEL